MQFHDFGRFRQYHETLRFHFIARENGRAVAEFFLHQLARRFAGGGVGNEVAVLRRHFRVQRVVDVFVRIGHVVRVFRNHERVNPNTHAGFGCEYLNGVFAACFLRTAFGNVQIAAVADGHAQIAVGQAVDIARRAEAFHVAAHLFEQGVGGFQIGGVVAVRVFAHVFQHQRILLGGAVEEADAAAFQFGGVLRVEDQIPFVGGHRRVAQGFGYLFGVDGQRVDAPEIRHGVFVARIDLAHQFQQFGVDIVVVRDLAFVDGAVRAGFNLAADVGNGWGDQVEARFAGQHFGFQHFVAVIEGLVDFDAGVFGEGFDGGGRDIVRPNIKVQFAGGFLIAGCAVVRIGSSLHAGSAGMLMGVVVFV